jgi:hypothetical protein
MLGNWGERWCVCSHQKNDHEWGKWRSIREKRDVKNVRREPEVAARKVNGGGQVTIRKRLEGGDR